MATKLIQLADGTLVEAEVAESEARPISGGAAERVASSFEKIEPVLVSVCKPVIKAWKAIGDQLQVESMQVELGLSLARRSSRAATRVGGRMSSPAPML